MSAIQSPFADQQLVTNAQLVHDDELIEELGRRIGRIWVCEVQIELAIGNPELIEFWRSIQSKEQERIEQIKALLE